MCIINNKLRTGDAYIRQEMDDHDAGEFIADWILEDRCQSNVYSKTCL